jgi:hypothetical protein
VAAQRGFTERGGELRARLLEVCDTLLTPGRTVVG